MSLTSFTVPLPSYGSNHLWLRPSDETPHAAHTCRCSFGDLGQCYEDVSEAAFKTTFKNAHKVIENGFKGHLVKRKSIINDYQAMAGSGLNTSTGSNESSMSPNGAKSPPQGSRHPLAQTQLQVFDLLGSPVQTRGPAHGNVAFSLRLPLGEMTRKGGIRVYQIEVIEFQEVSVIRSLLTRNCYPMLAEVDLTDNMGGGLIVRDGKLLALKTIGKIKGGPDEVKAMHEILFDDSLFPFLDRTCGVRSNLPLDSQVTYSGSDPIFRFGDGSSTSEFLVEVYAELLDAFNERRKLRDQLLFAVQRRQGDNRAASDQMVRCPIKLRDILSPEAIWCFDNYATFENLPAFRLTSEEGVLQAPKSQVGLERNCAVLYQYMKYVQGEKIEEDVESMMSGIDLDA